MKHLKIFENQTAYQQYVNSDDIWLPRVSYIINGGPKKSGDKYDDDGPSRVEYSRIGTEFIQIANNGIMYFTDQVYNGISYTAKVEGDSIVLNSKNQMTGEFTDDIYVDESNECIVVTYPSQFSERTRVNYEIPYPVNSDDSFICN